MIFIFFTEILSLIFSGVHNWNKARFTLLITADISFRNPQEYSSFPNSQVLHRNPHASGSFHNI